MQVYSLMSEFPMKKLKYKRMKPIATTHLGMFLKTHLIKKKI